MIRNEELTPCLESGGKSILVVDDEPNICRALKRALENEGYVVYIAFNGDEALKLVSEKAPDLVILDIMMPGMNGRDIAAKIRAACKSRIVYFSARADLINESDVSAIAGEADAFIVKPASSQRIISVISDLLNRR